MAFCLAIERAGNNRPAKMAMMAMTTSSSTSVKPLNERRERGSLIFIGLKGRPGKGHERQEGSSRTASVAGTASCHPSVGSLARFTP
jgi:hypothetical protein